MNINNLDFHLSSLFLSYQVVDIGGNLSATSTIDKVTGNFIFIFFLPYKGL